MEKIIGKKVVSRHKLLSGYFKEMLRERKRYLAASTIDRIFYRSFSL